MPSFLTALVGNDPAPYRLINERTGDVVAETLLVAFDSASRRTGLLRHTSLPLGEALIIAPCNSVHTFFMKFAIDIVFVSRDGEVRKVARAVAPWRMAASFSAFATIELAANTPQLSATRPGDRLIVAPREL